MTTIIPFVPPTQAPFQFQPTLDNNTYTGTVTWNTFGQRLYITLTAQDGTVIFTLPLIGSRAGVSIQSLTWANGFVTAKTIAPHGYHLTDTIALTIADCLPDSYNGLVDALIVAPDTIQWPLASDPGDPTLLGHIDYDVNLAGGYFPSSTLVFNEDAQQFEVTP